MDATESVVARMLQDFGWPHLYGDLATFLRREFGKDGLNQRTLDELTQVHEQLVERWMPSSGGGFIMKRTMLVALTLLALLVGGAASAQTVALYVISTPRHATLTVDGRVVGTTPLVVGVLKRQLATVPNGKCMANTTIVMASWPDGSSVSDHVPVCVAAKGILDVVVIDPREGYMVAPGAKYTATAEQLVQSHAQRMAGATATRRRQQRAEAAAARAQAAQRAAAERAAEITQLKANIAAIDAMQREDRNERLMTQLAGEIGSYIGSGGHGVYDPYSPYATPYHAPRYARPKPYEPKPIVFHNAFPTFNSPTVHCTSSKIGQDIDTTCH